MIRMLALSATLFAAAANAQTPAPASPPAPTPTPTTNTAVDVDAAYRKEYAFLSAQKRELAAQLAQMQAAAGKQQAALNSEIAALESRVLALDNESSQLQSQAGLAEEQAIANEETSSLLEATFAQAGSTLEGYGVALMKTDAFAALADGDKTAQMYAAAATLLGQLSRVRSEPGKFFLADGTEVSGTLVRVGNVAIYGVSDAGSGALAPAGGGAFKLWREPASDAAQALAKGEMPATLPLFLFENATAAVSEPEKKTFWNEMQKGGPIGYVILVLGAIALLLAALRALFLSQAGAAVQPTIEAAAPLVRQHRINEAIDAVKQRKGSAARVVTAALRNLDREREHLEDIISEAILHESTRLNRFGSAIMMIAAVAPLLGLLGTVTGMIQTFDVITEFGTSDPKLLAGGIAVALVTTEQGLLVAIPCLLLGNLLSGWADRVKDDMEQGAIRVINMFQERRETARAAIKAA
jgi:biopolymer transport protein ExbB